MTLTLTLLPENLAVCRLAPDDPFPDWAQGSNLVTFTRTPDELSIVCENNVVPENITAERDWRALKLQGPLDFSIVGILSALTAILAKAEISIFALSTYDTDYVLLKGINLTRGIETLQDAGYELSNLKFNKREQDSSSLRFSE